MSQAPAPNSPHSATTLSPSDYTPPPPVATDDTLATGVDYWTYHDSELWSPGSVQDNDYSSAGSATTELVTNVQDGQLTLNPDGTFEYMPTYHFFGIDSFTYDNVDAFGTSNVATVDIRVSEYSPTALDDGLDSAGNYLYQVSWNETNHDHNQFVLQGGMNQLADPPPIQANDSDPDGPDSFTFTSILDSPPQNGSLFHYSNPTSAGIDLDGGFIYVPKEGFSGYDTFTYHDTDGILDSPVATVHILVQKVDIAIWDGGVTGAEVPADKEATRGAYTVANLNDTQGNGLPDMTDSPVWPYSTRIYGFTQGGNTAITDAISGFKVGETVLVWDVSGADPQKLTITDFDIANGTITFSGTFNHDSVVPGYMQHYGRPEVDLMPLVIYPPYPSRPNTSVYVNVIAGDATLWADQYKFAQAGDGIRYSIDVGDIPPEGKAIFVEAGKSQWLRDIQIEASYNEAEDTVTATGIWSAKTAVMTDTRTAADVKGSFLDANGQTEITGILGLTLNMIGGTGNQVGSNGIKLVHSILYQFTVFPLRTVADGTWEADGVNVDVAREEAAGFWFEFNGTWLFALVRASTRTIQPPKSMQTTTRTITMRAATFKSHLAHGQQHSWAA